MRLLTLLALLPLRLAALPAAPPSLPTLPVICYHRFGEEDGSDNLKISARRLAEELRWLKREGYKSISLAQAREFLRGGEGGEPLPAKPIIFSVDDGYRSGWSVGGPIFAKYGFKAVYFVITDQVAAAKNFLGWEDLRGILAKGFEVQSHTADHTNLGKPLSFKIPIESEGLGAEFAAKHVSKMETPLDYHTRLRGELEGSRKKLEERLGIRADTLAYPFGAYNPVVESYARDAGYDLVMSVSGGVNVPGDNPLRVRRIIIVGHPSLASFKKKVLEKRLMARLEGLEEGAGFAKSGLPHKILIRLPEGREADDRPLAEMQGRRIPLDEEGEGLWSATLARTMKPGFYFFKVEAGSGPSFARDSYLFQIYRPGTQAYMVPLSPSAAPSPSPGAP
jgi:peptidoglycan/xylan/chitin deacetylase (PgdA/CDA1 family)